jgi:hypothetical protein
VGIIGAEKLARERVPPQAENFRPDPELSDGGDRSRRDEISLPNLHIDVDMAYLPPAQRALDVVAPVTIYRQIGRRLSRVSVDSEMNATKFAKAAPHRLKDRIYWRTEASPGDQIQDRPGGTLLVTAKGECYPILLAEPQPLEAGTAFTHADRAIRADRDVAERLLAEGKLIDATPRRPKGMPTRPADKILDDKHPLVVDSLPPGARLEAEPSAFGGRRAWRGGTS